MTSITRTSPTRRLLAGFLLPAGLVTLAACGSGATTTTATSSAASLTTTSATSPATTDEATTSSPAGSGTRSGDDSSSPSSPRTSGASGTSGAASKVPTTFTAFGTEPFWDVQVTGTTLTYSNPETASQVLDGSRSDSGSTAVYTGTHNGQRFTLTVRPGDCSDGMSDSTHPYTSTFEIDGKTLSGCGRN